MADSGYIALKRIVVDESSSLSILKSKFNRFASKLNVSGEGLSQDEIDNLLDKINELEQQINEYE